MAGITINNAEVTMAWTEPTTNADGSPVTDLLKTEGYFEIVGDVAGEQLCGSVLAALPTGGQPVSVICTVPVVVNTEKDVLFRAKAFDVSGNVSLATPDVTVRIDLLAPAPPVF